MMGLTGIVSRARTGTLLRSSTPLTTQESASFEKVRSESSNETAPLSEKTMAGGNQTHQGSVPSSGNTFRTSRVSATAPNKLAHPVVRTVPTWVQVLDDDHDNELAQPAAKPLFSPPSAQLAQHHHDPSKKHKNQGAIPRGRLHDRERESAPPILSSPINDHTSRWRAFANASAYPSISAEGGEIVTEEWLTQNGADYSRPFLAGAGEGDAENGIDFRSKRKVWWKRAQRKIIRSPMIPLVIRSIVWLFSLIALSVAASIRHLTFQVRRNNEARSIDEVYDVSNSASTKMAIIVDAIALVYLLYITYDEYSGKPLGLRSARAKMRLIFLDLFFIVFDSANLSLAFEALGDPQICGEDDEDKAICHRQQTLASVLLIALIAWLLTFSISVLRLVERVTHK